jgi:lysyl-tRNA synthetase class 2
MPLNYRPTASLAMLQQRAKIMQQLRAFFTARGFLEVETPVLSQDSVIDRHLDPLAVTLFADPKQPHVGPTYWLQTSPEFGMKRLVAAFAEEATAEQPLAIFQVTKAFRGGERGDLHNPEFTMVEWYRVGDDYQAGMRLLSDLAAALLHCGPAEILTYREAFQRALQVDPVTASEEELRSLASTSDKSLDRHALLDLLLVTRIESHLGQQQPTILCDYPADQAALARMRPDDPSTAERFELYVNGMELANGYHELLDPAILRERNQTNNSARIADGKYPLPADSRLLAAMDAGLPPCSGCALGFDRLVMAATGAKSLTEVIAFPSEIA